MFFGIYTAVYSAQNLQSSLLELAGYGPLGLISNAVAYVGQGIGSVYCQYYIRLVGDRKSMSWGSVISLPFIACLMFPTLSVLYPESANFFFSAFFVYLITIFTSFFNGFGEGIA